VVRASRKYKTPELLRFYTLLTQHHLHSGASAIYGACNSSSTSCGLECSNLAWHSSPPRSYHDLLLNLS
jgi:hypothetical protein